MSLTLYGKFTALFLEAEVSPGAEPDFLREYMKLTGSDPRSSCNFQRQDNKWGLEARIYFDAPDWVPESLETLGYHVENRGGDGYRSSYTYRVNSQDLFWKLVRHGYRLGENAPIPAKS
jgi:hypothetical protein